MKNVSRKLILNVPYEEKDKAKELGAWWDPDIKKWFVPEGKDVGLFSKWVREEGTDVDHQDRG